MTVPFTIQLDPDVLALAEQEAKARHSTLDDILRRYLTVMADNWRKSRDGRTPVTDQLRGVIELPADIDPKELIERELRKKYGD